MRAEAAIAANFGDETPAAGCQSEKSSFSLLCIP
jgi:hypothetical protein